MSSITAQQTKLDLELVPKEKRLDNGKCNGRLNLGKIQRDPTFQVVLDALALTPCYSTFLITADIDKRKRFKLTLEVFRDIFKIFPRVQGQEFDALPTDEEIMHQPWRTFAALIDRSLSGKTTGLDKLRLSRAQILWGVYHQKNVDYVELLWEDFIYQIDNKAYKKQDKMYYSRFTKVIIHYFLTQDKILSYRNKIRMHTSKDDYLINTLRFVSAREETKIYGALLPESLTSPEMKETKAYKTYIGFTSASTEEPTGKSKRVKRPAKKSTQAPARGIIVRETPEIPVSKMKEKVDVARGKGIELLSDVALTEEAQYEEVRKKSLRDFHKTHPSGSGIATKPTPSAAIIKFSVTNEGTGVKLGVPDVTEEESSESEAETWGNDDDDDSNNDQDSGSEESDQDKDSDDDKSQSDNEDESDSEHETNDNEFASESDQEEDDEKIKDDKEEEEDEIVKTPSNNSDDEDKTKIADKAEGDEDEEMDYTISLLYDDVDIKMNEPVDADKGISTIIPQSLQSFTPLLLLSTPTLPPTTKATNPLSTLLDFASVFQFNNRVTALEQEVIELKKNPLHTSLTALVDEHLNAKLGATRDEFMNFLSASLTARITKQVNIQLPQILPQEISNFAPPVIQCMINESLEHVVLAKESSQPESSYEAAAMLIEFKLKKILIDKLDKSESYMAAPEHKDCYEGLKKSYELDKTFFSTYDKPEEPEFEVGYSDMPQDQEENLGNDNEEPKEKVASKRDWFTKPTQPQEPTDPDWNADKTPQQGQNQSWLMTLASSAE
ncbi:hypothetical protein Tco_1006557 [Tanacetum coccineum]|uniref:Uncharacterized protein n=1 Tax=Tanacetum coccineum TaxID=301880 RepID=A0ABQ5FIX9_9ASTR